MVPPSALDEALARYSDSREVPRSVLKCETVFGTLDAISKFPDIPVSLERHHQLPEFTQTHVHQVGDAIQPSHPLSSPFPSALVIATGVLIPLLCLEGVPDLSSAPKDEAGLRRKFET